jgi:tetratricopeptide (TPR) repeat protein
MYKDCQENLVSGATSEAVTDFDAAVRAFSIYRGDPVAIVDKAIVAAPEFTMAHLLRAYLYVLATEPEAAMEAVKSVNLARELPGNEREKSHVSILDHVLTGNWNRAAVAMDIHNISYPHDLLGLQAGHLMDFYRGNVRDLRDRIARALPAWSPDIPGYPVVLGMYAFGLEESANYTKAEDTGRKAIDLEPLDCWAHHAVTHVMEMQGRSQDCIGWMVSREPQWSGDDNFFKVHNWWHRALCHLDLGQVDEVLRLYDGPIRGDCSTVALDMVDASALLWRLHLSGQDVDDRWEELAQCWDNHADGTLYPFNDWHAVMAYLGAGEEQKVDRVITSLQESSVRDTENAQWTKMVALPLIAGFHAFWKGNYRSAVEELHAVRYTANQFGGSNAQRDIIDWTLTEAALRGNLRDMAMSLANERYALKPHSPVNHLFLERARTMH